MAATSLAHAQVDFGIAAEGRIVPGDSLIAVAAPVRSGAAVVTELKVKAGDSVKPGDLLASLDGLDTAQLGVKAAEAQVAVAQAAVSIVTAKAQAAVDSATATQQQVTVAQKQLAEAQAGVDAAQKAMARALAEHDAASKNISGQIAEYQRVLDELDPPRKDREDLKVKQNMLALEVAKLADSRAALEAELQSQVATAQASVATAQAQVDAAQSSVKAAESDAAAAQAQVKQAEAEVASAQASVAQAQAELKAYQVFAPIAGTIIAVNARPGGAVGPNGICYLGDTSKMFVEAQVYIDDIQRVKVGQAVTIEGDAFDGEMKGRVTQVGLMVSPANLYNTDPTVFTDRRVVPVRIALNDSVKASKLIYAQVTAKISQSAE